MAVTSLGVIASGTYVGGAGTIVMPFTTNIPRSDPSLGATLIFWWATQAVANGASAGASIDSFSDDGASDPFYGTCYFSNGLNQYGGVVSGTAYNSGGQEGPVTVPFSQTLSSPAGAGPSYGWGLVLNPLTTANSLIATIGGSGMGAFNVFAIAYTGCALQGRLPADTPLLFWHDTIFGGGFFGEFTDIVDSRTTTSAGWTYNSATINSQPASGTIGPPFIVNPFQLFSGTVVYPNWQINGPGDLIVYTIADMNHGSVWPGGTSPYGAYDHGSSGGWTWGGAGPTTINEFDDYDGNGDGMLCSMLVAEQTLGGAAPITGQDISGSWGTGMSKVYTVGGAFTLNSGAGPAPCGAPPAGGTPVFDHRVRLLGATIGDFAPDASPCFNARIRLSQ